MKQEGGLEQADVVLGRRALQGGNHHLGQETSYDGLETARE